MKIRTIIAISLFILATLVGCQKEDDFKVDPPPTGKELTPVDPPPSGTQSLAVDPPPSVMLQTSPDSDSDTANN